MQYEYECPEHGRWLIEYPLGKQPDSVECDLPIWQNQLNPGVTEPCDHSDDDLASCKEKHCLPCGLESKRIFSFKMQPVMQSHYNVTVEDVVSDGKQFERKLKEKGDRLTERTGIQHDFAPLSPSEMKDASALGVTDAGLDETRKRRRAVE